MQVRYVRGSQIAGAVQDLQGMATAAAAADELAAHRARLAAELQDKARQRRPLQIKNPSYSQNIMMHVLPPTTRLARKL